ncbi:helix-turn-helix transcriptional regulator [Ralstonia insidiosa]|uniref:helix-turn-helix domain-containing protein n=1 Tax=Ralstonia insidiosa TaxID=190721 RepID=UPI00206FCB13|nr:helix-turn-helix transcriptional regulator [Ralstonia insidiosa]MDE4924343.1 helix-turn-helix transcriptional regulator [Ralstonia insidiosa]UNJ99886.1 helix-turn-helix transcriptional regulator [Ralstonia insidiosa]
MQITEHPETRAVSPSAGFGFDPMRTGRRFLPQNEIAACQSWRDACVLAWRNRAHQGMTQQMLAALAGLHAQHMSDYFHPEALHAKGTTRRQLPVDKIKEVERVLGNHVLTQYVAHLGMLTIMEAVIAERTA